MDKLLTFTIVGLATSAIYAVIASGLVLTYTTTGIFNFAHGAAGMLAAFTYWQLRFEWGWPTPVALVIILLVLAPLFGALLERVIMRGLGDTSETTKLVVSISLLLGMIGLAQIIWKPGVSRPYSTFFSDSPPLHLGPTTITWHQIITIAVAIGVAIGLRFLLYATRTGVAMRATVDDRPLAALNGARAHRVSMYAWSVGTSLAALGGILIAPLVPLDAATLSLLIVSAYAAAIFGRLRSLPMTFVGAIVVGCTEGYLSGYLPQNQYLPGLRLASPAILLFLVLLAMPHQRLRGRTRTREFFPMPTRSGAMGFALGVAAFGIVLATTLSRPDLLIYGKIFSIGIIALSLVPLVGFAGQVSLAQLSFAGIGAIVMAHLGTDGNPMALVYAALITGAIGAIIALPALRLSGIYLALGTAAFAMALDRWVFTLPKFSVFGWFDIDLFQQGSVSVDSLAVFGYSFDTPARQMVLMSVAFALLSLLVVAIRRGRLGRRLLAMKDSEAACATLGLNLLGTKVLVFSLSAAMAGVGGALLGTQLSSISPQNFDLVMGLPIFALTVVGGIGAAGGALFGSMSLDGVLPVLGALLPSLTTYLVVLPGLAGIGLGRNPSGAVHELREAFLPIVAVRPALIATVGALTAIYALRMVDAIDNWTYVIASLAVPVVAVIVAGFVQREAPTEAEEVPLEWRGITEPWSEEDVRELDRALGISEVQLHG
ncbi:MAG TPA: ABC transporter permease [Acidimicrobiia bacterium]|nr:ABC transporter permease [Acidimicrobiia bacterium]